MRGVELQRCNSCTFVQVRTVPSSKELATIYGADYFQRGKYQIIDSEGTSIDSSCSSMDNAALREQRRRIRLLTRCGMTHGARVLDVGCATADFIFLAKQMFEMWGCDISEFAIKNAKMKNADIASRIRTGVFSQCGFEERYFDAITLWDVIEHVPDPVDFVRTIKRYLKPGGLLFLSTPNIGAPAAKLMGARWAFMTPDEHLCFFSHRTISLLLQQNSLKIVSWMTKGKWSNVGFLVYKLQKMFSAAVPVKFSAWVQRRALRDLTVYIPSGDVQYVGAKLEETSSCAD